MCEKKSLGKLRCAWLNNDPLYIHYHDTEWGIPQYYGRKLFEKLCLEGQQAGLSWLTVLKKRECYRECFYHFDPNKIVLMTEKDVDNLMTNTGLIRHRSKLNSIINNAQAFLEMQKNGELFSIFIWSFVQGTPIINRPSTIKNIPTKTIESDLMANALKKRGFSFVGSTTCYAFMQSMGLINDHTSDCFCYNKF